MRGQLTDVLSQVGTVAEPIGWLTLALFLLAVVLDYVDREYARYVFVTAWLLFSLFWATLIYPFFVQDESIIRGVGAVLAAPLSVLVARVLYSGRDELFTLSRSIPLMGLIYVPFLVSETLREQLVLLVTGHTAWAMNRIGYDPPLVTELSEAEPYVPAGTNPDLERDIGGKEYAFENSFVFFSDGGGTITYTIILACTGIGSMAVIGGLVLAVNAPLRRKLRALSIALPIIYVLNIVRNVFIGISFGHQYANFAPELTMTVFALENELRVSYIWADRIIAQSASVIAMVVIFWLVVREVPEVMDPVEEVLYLLTGEELDLAEALNVDREPTEVSEPVDPAD